MLAAERALPSPQPQPKSGVRIKTIALPAEHGGWGLLFEPIVLGLLLAPSVAGFYLALSAVSFFLARHPLALMMVNRRRASPRTVLARRFAALYLAIGTASFVAGTAFAEHSFVLPLLIAAPFAILHIAHDWTGHRRVLLSEVAGAIAISSLAAALTISAGWPAAASFALWAIMIARSIPAIFFVRACLARMHRRPASYVSMLIAHFLALAAVTILALAGLAPRLSMIAMAILLLRSLIGFTKAETVTARQLGFAEIGFGVMTVISVVLGQ